MSITLTARKRAVRVVLLASCLGLGAQARAEELAGLTGLVTDATGQPLPGVAVLAEPGLTGSNGAATTDGAGRYALGLAPGRYRVSFRLPGYATQEAPAVTVDGGATRNLDTTLNLALTFSVVVTARSTFRNLADLESAGELVGAADAASTGLVAASQIEERSLLRPADVLERVPGLVVSQHSGEGKGNQ